MEKQIQVIKKPMVVSCPNCRFFTLYSVRERQKWVGAKNEEFLLCKSCGLIIHVDDLKRLLFCT